MTLIGNSEDLPVESKTLAEGVDDDEIKTSLYAEYFTHKFTGSSDDIRYTVATVLDNMIKNESDKIGQVLLKVNDPIWDL